MVKIVNVSLLFAVALAATLPAFARESIDDGTMYCKQLIAKRGIEELKIQESQNRFKTANTKARENIAETRRMHDTWAEEKIAVADGERKKHVDMLLERAMRDSHKSAIIEYRSALESAVAARRGAMQNAVNAFRTKVERALSQRESSLGTLITQYNQAVQDAFDRATTLCKTQNDPMGAQEELALRLKQVQENFISKRRTLPSPGAIAKEASNARATATKSAIASFDETLEAARANLFRAFDVQTSF